MKTLHIVSIFLVLSTFSFAEDRVPRDPWPKVNFTKVVGYCYDSTADKTNDDIIDKNYKLHKGIIASATVTLTKKQTSKLISILAQPPKQRHIPAACFIPHHAFVFYDADNDVVAHVSICFMCIGRTASPSNLRAKLDYASLEKFSRSIGLPMLKRPEDYSTMYRLQKLKK